MLTNGKLIIFFDNNYLIGITYQNECELSNAICGLNKEHNQWDPMGSEKTKLELDYRGPAFIQVELLEVSTTSSKIRKVQKLK